MLGARRVDGRGISPVYALVAMAVVAIVVTLLVGLIVFGYV